MAAVKRKAKSTPDKERHGKRPKSEKTEKVKPTPAPPVEEEAFRRGGADLLTPLERKQIRAQAKQDVLLEEETGEHLEELLDSEGEAIEIDQDEGVAVEKQSKKRRKESFGSSNKKNKKTSKIDGLSYKRIHKGLVVLGCITRIGKRDITLALPNNLTGFVSIASISAGLRRQLEEEDDASSGEDVIARKPRNTIEVSKFVKIGQYLRASVSSLGEGTKKHIQLSTMPKDVNVGLKMEDLIKNATVQAEIVSIEDHGAIVDLGLASGSVSAFIPASELDNQDLSTVEIGSPILCSVTSSPSNGKVVKLSANSTHLSGKNSVKTVSDVNALLPGTVVEFIVQESDEHGIRGRFMDLVDITADVVHSGQLFNLDAENAIFKAGKKVKARIIFTTAGNDSRHIGVSFLPQVLSLSSSAGAKSDSGKTATDMLPISTIVDEVKVTKVDPTRGLLLDVGIKGISGYAHISRLSEKRVKDLSAISGQWREGSVHRGRILGFNPLDGLFLVSLEEKVLELPFLSYEDAKPGQTISGTVSKYKSQQGEIRGVILQITDSTSGMIPANHLADVQLQFPEKKFKMDSVVRARVLSVDPDRRRMTLTCKKTLLNSKAGIWTSYADVQVGSQSPGTIISFLPSGALVEFYNHLKGFLPTSEMSESFIKDPKEHFRLGQVINLRAITVNIDQRRLIVSCRQDTETTAVSEQLLETLAIGSLVEGKVSEKLADELVLDLKNSGIKAVLPISHLVDGSQQKCEHAAKRMRVEQTLQDVAIINLNKNKRYIRLTKKPSLLEALKSGKMPSSFDSLSPGAEVVGFVKNITDIGIFVQFANNLTGLLPKAQIIESSSTLPDFGLRKNQTVTSRILSVDLDQQRFFLTQKEQKLELPNRPQKQTIADKPSAVANPIDGSSTEFTLGQLTKAKITSVKDTQLNVKLADGIQGRIDVSQVFDSWEKIKHKKQPLKTFQNGQTIDVRIMGIHDTKTHKFLPITHKRGNPVFELTARPGDQIETSQERLTVQDMKIGDTHLCYVNNVRADHIWVNVNTEIRGRINVMELTEDPEEIADLAAHYPVGCALKGRVIQVNAAENRLDLSARPVDKTRPQVLDDLSVDQIVVGKVIKVLEKLVIVQISENISGAIHICDLDDDYSKANTKALKINQVLSAVVLSIDKERKDIWLSSRPSKLAKPASPIVDPELSSIQEIKVNDVRRGFIKNITDQGLFVSLSRDLTAFVRVSELFDQFVKNWKDKFSLNQLVKGKVITVKTDTNQIQLSLKESTLGSKIVATLTFEDLEIGHVYNGKVRKVEDFGVFVVLDNSQNVSGLCHKTEIADGSVSSVKDLYDEGDSVKVKVLKIDKSKKRVNLGMKTSYISAEDNESEIDADSEDEVAVLQEDSSEDEEMLSDEDGGIAVHPDETALKSESTTKSEQSSGSKSFNGLDLGGFDWTGGMRDENSDIEMLDAADENSIPTKKKKHGAAAIQIDQTGDLDKHGAQSVADFERLLMGQPNSSYLWLSYMAFHLQLSEVEKARQVAERALRIINSESRATQDEALNVWIGYLNLENSYGDDESVEDIFERACTHNDPKEVYTRLTSIYIQSGKQGKAKTLFEDMIKKFSSDPKVWQNYASFLFDIAEDATKARTLVPRAMQALPSYAHIDIASKFAQLEFKSPQGDNERGRTIFEGLITNFPKRLDLWNVLLDLEIKYGEQEQVRQLFDRVTTGNKKIKVQKAKFFFKKWLEYEEKNGDVKSQEKVKAKAAEFVRKHEEAKTS